MKTVTLLKAINDVQDDYIESAAPRGCLPKQRVSFSWINIRSLASVMAVLVIAVFAGRIYFNQKPELTVNPYQTCSSLKEASEITGYMLSVPESLLIEKETEIIVYDESITEFNVLDSEYQTIFCIRKATGDDDISGVYEIYETEKTVNINNKEIVIKGNNNLYYLAVWTNEGYSYSFFSNEGISEEGIRTYINQVK